MEPTIVPQQPPPISDLQRTLRKQKLLYEVHASTTESIINFQHAYVKYLVIILIVLILLFVLWEVKKILRMRKIKHKYASLIDFIDGIKYHLEMPPMCLESNRYTKTDGLTLVYYYQYPHSFMNPFRNINFPPAVVLAYYSAVTNAPGPDGVGCFSRYGDYVGLMLSYSEFFPSADAGTIICNSGWLTDSPTCQDVSADCPDYCCPPLSQCENFCRPFYEETLADIISDATLNAAGAGFLVQGTISGGKFVYGKIKPDDVPLEPFEDPEWALGSTEKLEQVSQMTVEQAMRASPDVSELATEATLEAAPEFTEAAATTAGTAAAETASAETAAAVTTEAATDAAVTGAFVGTESAAGALDATVIGAPIGVAIGVVAAIGFGVWMGLSSNKKRKQQCDTYHQYCISNDAAGEC